jgi:hypothetical protein
MKVGVGNVFKLVARLLHELARKLNVVAASQAPACRPWTMRKKALSDVSIARKFR